MNLSELLKQDVKSSDALSVAQPTASKHCRHHHHQSSYLINMLANFFATGNPELCLFGSYADVMTYASAASSLDFMGLLQRVLLDATVKPTSPAWSTFTVPLSATLAMYPPEPLALVRSASFLFPLSIKRHLDYDCGNVTTQAAVTVPCDKL